MKALLEALLHDVFGVLSIACHAMSSEKDLALVPFDQQLKCRVSPVFAPATSAASSFAAKRSREEFVAFAPPIASMSSAGIVLLLFCSQSNCSRLTNSQV